MVLKYYIKEKGTGAYVVGEDTDSLWDPATCIEVPQCPSPIHKWNNVSHQWEINIEDKRTFIRRIRDIELRRTDKFMISDFPITESDKTIAETYRQELRDLPSKQTIEELEMPEIPAFIQV